MGSRLLSYWDDLRASYWFIPALMAIGAVAVSVALLQLDARLGQEPPFDLGWLYNNQPDGARAVLSTIAGSMITVAGVVFSITLVTVSGAAAQYGPRLLTNFMRDRTNQTTLGTFTATFLYCLLVLRAVQNAPNNATGDAAQFFVPHVSLLVAILMAFISVGVLIRFIHHVPESIHISNVIARIGANLRDGISQRFPELKDDEDRPLIARDEDDDIPSPLQDLTRENGIEIKSESSGYVRLINKSVLAVAAASLDIYLRLLKQPGDFIFAGEPFAIATTGADLDADMMKKILGAVVLGKSRSPAQDIDFLVEELVEIAARALSPGINDPVTAIGCMNWLAAAVAHLSTRRLPSTLRSDEAGDARVLIPDISFATLLETSFGALIPYVARDKLAATAFIDRLARMKPLLGAHHDDAINSLIDRLLTVARDSLHAESYAEITRKIEGT